MKTHFFTVLVFLPCLFSANKTFSQADNQLSNLVSPTKVNVPLLPVTDNTKNLGSATKSWKDIYFAGSLYLDDVKFVSNAGTRSAFGGQLAGNSNSGDDNSGFGNEALFTNRTGFYNTAIGSKSIYSNSTGSSNTALGYFSLYANTTGSQNTALGVLSLRANTTGLNNTAVGYQTLNSSTASNNTAVGSQALASNTTASDNTAVGFNALFSASNGGGNTAIGSEALTLNGDGVANIAVGVSALANNISGDENLAIGYHALENYTADKNIAIGNFALQSNISGSQNTAVGHDVLQNNTASYNTAVGFEAMTFNSSGNSNTAIGTGSMRNNTTGSSNTAVGNNSLNLNSDGLNNTAIGLSALLSNQHGDYNTAVGELALVGNTTGDRNTAIGGEALTQNNIGADNIAMGYQALRGTNGSKNVAVGNYTMYENISGYANTAMGYYALHRNNNGGYNSAFGENALVASYGTENTACGDYALFTTVSGSNNTALGNEADVSFAQWNNATAIGNEALATSDNQVRIGNSSVTSIGGYTNWTNISDGRFKKDVVENVPGLKFINLLRPVTYMLDVNHINSFYDEIKQSNGRKYDKDGDAPATWKQKAIVEKASMIYTGFVAQEVEAAAKKISYDFSGVDKPQNDHTPYGLRYAEFVVPLVKAVQELDEIQNSKFESQNAEILELKKENNELKERLLKLEAMMNVYQPAINGEATSSIKVANSNIGLEQNIPNPFNRTTTINYTLPQTYSSAKIIVYDETGHTVKSINLSGAGKGNINFSAPFRAGASYQYSLYVDGKLIDTKQMVLAK